MSSALRIVQEFFPNVDDVKDGKKTLTIEVSPRDAATSKKRAHKDCAMAIACKRSQHVDGVIVSRSMAYLIKGTTATRYHLPMAVQKEVIKAAP